MSRITETFKRLKQQNRKALIPFITAGDPSLAATEKIVLLLEKAGADIIELGVPFSDPMADGPVIAQASERALKQGTTLGKILNQVAHIRQKSEIPILLMGYYNPFFVMGFEFFAKKAKKAGVDAVLVVDLPPEEAVEFHYELSKQGIHLIFLLAPTSTPERIKKAVKLGSGFLYYVSLTGVTGGSLEVNQELGRQTEQIRRQTSLPLAIGFGISKPAQARQIAPFADGVVIGSALVHLITQNVNKPKELYKELPLFIQSFKKVI